MKGKPYRDFSSNTKRVGEIYGDVKNAHQNNEGDLVFDGFGGSGTTAIAAHKSNRNFIVIEKEKKYYESAKKWLDTERAQLKMF